MASGRDRDVALMNSQQLQMPSKSKPVNIPAQMGEGLLTNLELRSNWQLMAGQGRGSLL